MKIIYFTYIDCLSLLSLLRPGKKYDRIYYFNISGAANFLLKCFKMNEYIRYFDFYLSELKDESNESYYQRIFGEDLINICDEITDKVLKNKPFINALGKLFDPDKIIIFFKKCVEAELKDTVIFMNAIRWHRQCNLKNTPSYIEFYIDKPQFFSVLRQFALKEYNLILRLQLSLKNKFKAFYLIIRNSKILINTFLISILSIFKILDKYIKRNKMELTPKIGTPYRYGGITFDLMQRCDFPWLLNSDIPFKQVIVYFDNKYNPGIEELVNSLRRKGNINYLTTCREAAVSKNIPIYKLTSKSSKEILRIFKKLLPYILREILILRLYYINKAIYFINQYSRYYDFFLTNNIKINIDRDDYNPYLIAEQIALKNTGGISISYQQPSWSIPNIIIGSCADVIFLFGPYYYPIVTKSSSNNDTIIFCGFLYDYSFKVVRESSRKLREKLMNSGAKFILCYFDENSTDDRMSSVTNKQSEYNYRKLLNWVISDNEMGLICSPKKPATLLNRIPGIRGLVENAKATGRCLFMEGKVRTVNYPNEAAQASDIAIGSLIGSTTALESFLSGARTVYLDTEGLYSFPEYEYGKNLIVFDDIDTLISTLNIYRKDKNSFKNLGNIDILRKLIESKDPFRDGRAAERMGQYLKLLLDAFNHHYSKQQALDYANKRYKEIWGDEASLIINDHHG